MVVEEFSIFEQVKPTKQDLSIIFTPNDSIIKYEYRIIKDNVYDDYILVDNNEPTTIILSETGTYKIEVKAYDTNNNTNIISSGIYNMDKEKPIIELDNYYLEIPIGTSFDIMEGIKAYDNQLGDLTDKITTNYDELDFTTTGLKN